MDLIEKINQLDLKYIELDALQLAAMRELTRISNAKNQVVAEIEALATHGTFNPQPGHQVPG